MRVMLKEFKERIIKSRDSYSTSLVQNGKHIPSLDKLNFAQNFYSLFKLSNEFFFLNKNVYYTTNL